MNSSEFNITINASPQKVWEVLFNQYGDIHNHNPTMQSSNYMNESAKGDLNVVRHCQFTDKLYVEEKITEAHEYKTLAIVVTNHNLPLVKEMSATYKLTSIGKERTEVKMTSFNSFSPSFMKYLMKGQMGKSIGMHLFGLKYYIETGKTVTKKNYSTIFKNYK
tara:strand:- start:205 stop:693 length:489 start_codon:yes stop_codon:yes gene_type:complete